MILINQCNQKILCTVQEQELCLFPDEKKEISVSGRSVCVKLAHPYKSSYGPCFDLDNVYQMVISSCFLINGMNEKSTISITREKVHFELFHVFDRYFCHCENCTLSDETHQVDDLDALLQSGHKKKQTFAERLFDFLLLDKTFIASTLLFLVIKLIFWFNEWPFSWWYILLFWTIGLGFQIWFEKIISKSEINKKVSDLKEFSESLFIKQYFSNPNREWIGNDIEIN